MSSMSRDFDLDAFYVKKLFTINSYTMKRYNLKNR